MKYRYFWILVFCALSACSDNNDSDPSEDMTMTDMSSDLPEDMLSEGCLQDGQSYDHDEEVCLNRQLFKCNDGSLDDLAMECGDPFAVDIRVVNFKGTSGKVGGIDSVIVTGSVVNQGTMSAQGVTCTYVIKLQGQATGSTVTDLEDFVLKPDEPFETEVVRNHNDIGNGKTGTFEYECTATNEDEEAKTIGNSQNITFTY